MGRLSKRQLDYHNRALKMLESNSLTHEDREYIFHNFQEGAKQMQGYAGAFFTPLPLAYEMTMEMSGGRIIDLCAGIGALAYAAYTRFDDCQITCVEMNHTYYEVGKKLVPWATWIHADITDIWQTLGRFDCAISNPPFGNVKTGKGSSPYYKGSDFEYKAIDIAAEIAKHGVFILPQQSTPFRYSDHPFFEQQEDNEKYQKFKKQTGLEMEFNCGIDTTFAQKDWHDVSPTVEIVCFDFSNGRNLKLPRNHKQNAPVQLAFNLV